MAEQSEYRYDVFVSYSSADRAWVEEWLLPRLERAGLRVAIDYRDFVVGLPRIENIERTIENSRRTIVVLTPDWLASEWNAFEALLLRTRDPAARQRKLLPVLLKPCDLPDTLAALERVDLTVERHWEQQIKRLTRDMADVIPVAPPWTTGRGIGDFAQWGKWLRRYRRQLCRVAAVIFILWLLLSLLLELPPFEQRLGWQALSPRLKDAWRLSRAGDVLLVSTRTDFPGCKSLDDTGLWRSTDGGASWQQVVMPTLEFERLDGQCDLAAITWFAHALNFPQRIYASTTDVGLLRTDDAGATWRRIDENALPTSLSQVAVAPEDPDHVFATAGVDQVGVYRSLDGGANWQRLDGAATCASGAEGRSLPEAFHTRALLVTTSAVYVGSDGTLQRPGPAAGLYVSRDNGDCWQRLDAAEGRYKYQVLAAAPAVTDQTVALTYDFSADTRGTELALWRVQADQGRTRILWQSGNTAESVYVDVGEPLTWYMATDVGRVFHGSLDAGDAQELPRITRCMFPPTCWTDLAPDFAPGPPLLLANDRVYRQAIVPWYHYLWP